MNQPPRRFQKGLVVLTCLLVGLSATGGALACPNCATSEAVWSQVSASHWGLTLGVLSFAFSVVAALIVLGARLMHRSRLLFGGALLLGAGMGAFLDGILLHQVLQWHAMISDVLPPLNLVSSKVNMFWDGIFHLYSWAAAVVGMTIVLREIPKAAPDARARAVLGGALGGWGFFNLVEGIIDHHIFKLHHVHPGFDELAWDIGFLVSGVVLIVAGFALAARVLRAGVGGWR